MRVYECVCHALHLGLYRNRLLLMVSQYMAECAQHMATEAVEHWKIISISFCTRSCSLQMESSAGRRANVFQCDHPRWCAADSGTDNFKPSTQVVDGDVHSALNDHAGECVCVFVCA